MTINSTTGLATKVNDGWTTLTATLTGVCESFVLTKNVYVGVLTTSLFSIQGPGEVCPGMSGDHDDSYYYYSGPASATEYNWTYSSHWPFGYSPSIDDLKLVNPPPGFNVAWVKLSVKNICGWSLQQHRNVFEQSNCGSMFLVYPNPANQVLHIEFDENLKESFIPETVSLFAEKSKTSVMTFQVKDVITRDSKNNAISMDIQGLERGVYYLHVKSWDGKVEKLRVLME